jgi:hypothetical protein
METAQTNGQENGQENGAETPQESRSGPREPEDPKGPHEAQPVIGIVLEMLTDGTLRVRQSESSVRAVNVHDVNYLLHRADRESLVQQVAAAVTHKQFAVAQQMRNAAILQQAAALKGPQG